MERETVLLLEHNDFDAAVVRELLEKCCRPAYAVRRCANLAQARRALSRENFVATLANIGAADQRGLKMLREILEADCETPALALCDGDEGDSAADAIALGAQDVLPKSGLDSRVLQRSVAFSVARKARERRLKALARRDGLTGVANRTLLFERYERALLRARRAERCVGALVVALENYARVNQAYGEDTGDRLLVEAGALLVSHTRPTDIVARLGGDEFVVVVENIAGSDDLCTLRDRLLDAPRRFLCPQGQEITFAIAIGAAVIDPAREPALFDALRRADADLRDRDPGPASVSLRA